MRTILNFQRLCLLVIGLIAGNGSYAQFETTFGDIIDTEQTADVKPLPNGNFIVLASTYSLSVKRILLAELSSHGYVVWYKAFHETGVPGIEYTAKSLQLAYDSTGVHAGYFVTGCRGNSPGRMVVIRTDLDGDPIWTAAMDNEPNPSITLNECGISLELQPNGDVIAIGTSSNDQASTQRFSMTRFNPYGGMLWSYRYGSPQDLKFYPAESCNGNRNGSGVVAVVGRVEGMGSVHSFMSCIRSSNGTEFWRQTYNSSASYDVGLDVVQNPLNQRFMLVGAATSPDDGPYRMWVCSANAVTGSITGGALYTDPGLDLFANDVCLTVNSNAAVVAGWKETEDESDAFAMQLPFLAGALPTWSYTYTASDPYRYAGDESIERITGTTPGYIIGTQAYLENSLPGYYDIHAIRIQPSGRNHFIGCPEVAFVPEVELQGTSADLHKKRTQAEWTYVDLHARSHDYNEEICDTSTMAFAMSHPDGAVTLPDISVSVFPNPIYAGDEVTMQIELPESTEVEIQLMDLTNRQHGNWRESREEGTQTFSIQIPETPLAKVYVVRITLATGQQRLIKLLVH